MALNGEYSYGQTYIQDGKSYTIINNNFDSNYITVKDENGHVIRFPKNEALLKFQNDREEKRKEEIAYYQEKAEEAGAIKMDWMAKIKDLWTQLSTLNKEDKEYNSIKDEYWAARFAKTAAGNREYSAYLSAFIVASDPIV